MTRQIFGTRIALLLVIIISVMSCGCASVSMQSVKDPSFSEPMNKLFVILNHGEVDRIDSAYTPYLLVALKNEFAQRGIKTEYGVLSPLTLEDQSFQSEITAYKPEGILTIFANGGTRGNLGGMMSINYDVSLYDTAKSKRVWRAHIRAAGGAAIREKRMNMMAKDLVDRLSSDRFLSDQPRKSNDGI